MSHKKITFKGSVEACPLISARFLPGIQALTKEHRAKISSATLATGSIDLDEALRADRPSDPRWDYGIGVPYNVRKEGVIWIEVHHVASKQTEVVLKKLAALKMFLAQEATALGALPKLFIWQASNRSARENPNDQRRRKQRATKAGLILQHGTVDLEKFKNLLS